MKIFIYIGRFQPLHFGHLHLVREALQQADFLFILLGSSQESRTLKNIWNIAERQQMFSAVLNENELKRIHFLAIKDNENDDLWFADIKTQVEQTCREKALFGSEITLIGHKKDESSYYLQYFPEWHYLEVENYKNISATPLREAYLRDEEKLVKILQEALPTEVFQYLQQFKQSDDFKLLQQQFLATRSA